MEKDKKKFDFDLLNGVNINDVIEHYGVDNMLENITDMEIANYLYDNENILRMVDAELLLDSAFSHLTEEEVLGSISLETIAKYLKENDEEDKYYVKNPNDLLCELCKQLKPRGFVDKEEAKKLICDYIDDNVNNGFFNGIMK